jgi:hypothetical protein
VGAGWRIGGDPRGLGPDLALASFRRWVTKKAVELGPSSDCRASATRNCGGPVVVATTRSQLIERTAAFRVASFAAATPSTS